MAAGADLVQSPVNFQAMAIGIKKLYRDLTTGPAAPFKRDRDTLFPQPLAHCEDLLDRPDLESDMVQLFMLRERRSVANQRNGVMIGMAAQKCKSAGLQVFRINLSHFKSQNLRVEKQ
jgi:hypothetical protein